MTNLSISKTHYSVRLLDCEATIASAEAQLERVSSPTIKGFIAASVAEVKIASRAQKDNYHLAINPDFCSCALAHHPGSSEEDGGKVADPIDLFRSIGHVDHQKGELTTLFLVAFESGPYPHLPKLLLWNCATCGIVGQARNDIFDPALETSHICNKSPALAGPKRS